MTPATAGAVAERPVSSTTDADWVLSVALDGAHRLTGVDLPVAERGPVQAVFHGLLFDREQLISTLGLPGDAPNSSILLAAYERWRDETLNKLRGCFVVAIADRSEGGAVVARDQLGLHPLFYASNGRKLVFASSPRALFASPGISKRPNRAALADHLCYRWPDTQETFYEGVRRVVAGTRVIVAGGPGTNARE
jgi:asparagine synthase (glutamine-hydrolysing)